MKVLCGTVVRTFLCTCLLLGVGALATVRKHRRLGKRLQHLTIPKSTNGIEARMSPPLISRKKIGRIETLPSRYDSPSWTTNRSPPTPTMSRSSRRMAKSR